MPRIYQDQPLASQTSLTLDEQASHHLSRVLRAEVNDPLVLFNGQGGEYEATITAISKKSVTVQIGQFVDKNTESPLTIHLAQGLARGEKMDFIIQKAVELGVTEITPLYTERGNVRLDAEREAKRVQHWQSVVISACEQSGRQRIPVIHAPQALAAWLPQAKADRAYVLSPHQSSQPLPPDLPSNASVLVLVGPEGGLSDPEVEAAIRQGFLPLNLGPRILRTETAPLAALSILQYAYGDMKMR